MVHTTNHPIRYRGIRENAFFRIYLDPPTGTNTTAPAANPPATPPTQTQSAGTPPQNPPAAPAGLTQEQVNALVQPILQQVQTQVRAELAPLQQQTAALQQRVDQAVAPQRQAAGLLFGGGAPAVHIDGTPGMQERDGYCMYRALGLRQGFYQQTQAKVELDVHQRLRQAFVDQGGMTLESAGSLLVPLGASCLSGMDNAFAHEVRQMLRQGLCGFDGGEAIWQLQRQGMSRRQALSQFDDTGMGVFLGPTQTGEFIELLRAKEVFSRLGATEISLPPNGRLQFPRQTGSTTAYWVGEVPSNKSTPTITSSEPTTGYLTLHAKKLAVLTKLPNELLRFANPTVEAFLRNDIARVMALKADHSMLEAVGSTVSIKGLINYSGIKTHTASTVATDGNTLEPEDLGMMISKVEEADHDVEGWGWAMRPQLFWQIMNRRSDSGESAGDGKGPWMFPMNRDDVTKGMPASLLGYPTARSTQISKARSKGSGTDLTYLLGGVFEHWLIARVGVLEFASSTQGDTPFTTDQTWTRAIQHLDAGPRYEDAFCICDQLLRE